MPSVRLMLGILLTARLAAAGEILPPPTGPHPTGRTSFHWTDAHREELETKAAGDPRELMVHLFYPAAEGATGERAVYMPDAETMTGAMPAKFLPVITAMRAHSLETAPLPAGDSHYPVAICQPGGGMKGLTYHTLCEDLASHGWIVAAIDPPYNARAVRFPDGRVLGKLNPEEQGWPKPTSEAEYRRYYQERIAHWCQDVRFVIDQLSALDKGDGPFAGRIDLSRGAGAFGHSRGGQAAGTARLVDDRVAGAINLDGMLRELAFQPVKGDDVVGEQPLLWIHKGLPPPPSAEQLKRAGRTIDEYHAEVAQVMGEWKRRLSGISKGALRVSYERPGVEHVDFSDESLWDPDLTDEARQQKLQTIAETRAWIRAFLDGSVRGNWTTLQGLAEKDHPADVEVHKYGQLWP